MPLFDPSMELQNNDIHPSTYIFNGEIMDIFGMTSTEAALASDKQLNILDHTSLQNDPAAMEDLCYTHQQTFAPPPKLNILTVLKYATLRIWNTVSALLSNKKEY